ncbi:hypothetical protein L0Y49_02205 [bacterium]|nr:hypothetical protein [bacterium]MCI0565561.1 hypothetical protein [bacterium]
MQEEKNIAIWIIVGILAVCIAAFGGYRYGFKEGQKSRAPEETAGNALQEEVLESVNPFTEEEVSANPFEDGYENPFEQETVNPFKQ